MKAQNIISYFGGLTIADLLLLSGKMNAQCLPNTNFTFSGTTFTDFRTAQGDYSNALFHGLDTAPSLRIAMLPLMSVVAVQVNVQAAHDVLKLKSSGGDLTSVGGTIGIFDKVVINSIVAGEVTGTLVANLETEEKALGTLVYLVNLKTLEAKSWFTSEKHIITVSSLAPGTEYSLAFAWVGTDSTLNPSDPLPRYPQN